MVPPSRSPEPWEVEILGLIAQGLTNPEIAARLFLSNHTIKTHINRIFAKTGSRDRAAPSATRTAITSADGRGLGGRAGVWAGGRGLCRRAWICRG